MLHLKTFGGPSVDIGGLPGTGAAQQRKTLALLALLAAAGDRGLSRDKLIAFLWPETDAEHGRRLLKQACYALRRDLHAPELFLGSIHLRLNPAVISSDVGSFAAALEVNDPARAVSSYTAPFLDGFYLNGGGEFETWAETERARLASQCRTALEVLSVAATRRGEHREAAEWWRRLLALDPMSAHAALGLMTALARQYAAAYLRLDPTDVNAPAIRLAALMLDPAQARAPETARVIDSTSAKVLLDAGTAHLGWWADSGETAVRLLREMTTRSGNGALPWTDTLMYRRFLANALAFRGHLHEAYAADRPLLLDPKASPFWNFADPFRALALLGAIPESLVATTYGHALESGTAWYMSRFFTDRQLRGLPWWLARRDTTSLARFALAPSRKPGCREAPAASSKTDTSTRPPPRISRWLEPIRFGPCVSFSRFRTRSVLRTIASTRSSSRRACSPRRDRLDRRERSWIAGSGGAKAHSSSLADWSRPVSPRAWASVTRRCGHTSSWSMSGAEPTPSSSPLWSWRGTGSLG